MVRVRVASHGCPRAACPRSGVNEPLSCGDRYVWERKSNGVTRRRGFVLRREGGRGLNAHGAAAPSRQGNRGLALPVTF